MVKKLRKIVSFLFLNLFVVGAVFAEEVVVYGVPFSVDSLRSVDAQLSELTLDRHSELVKQSSLNARIIEHALFNGTLKEKGAPALKAMLTQAISGEDRDSSILILRAMFSIDRTEQHASPPFEQEIFKASPIGMEILKHVATIAREVKQLDAPYVAQLLFILLQQDAGIDLNLDYAERSLLAPEILTVAKSRLLALVSQEIDSAHVPVIIKRAIGDSSFEAGYIENAWNLGSKASLSSKNMNLNGLYELLGKAGTDTYLKSLVEPFVVKTLHIQAAKLIDQGAAQEALSILSDVPLIKRTPTTHSLIVKALQSFKVDSKDGDYLDPEVMIFLNVMAEKDPAIKEQLSRIAAKSETSSNSMTNFALYGGIGLLVISLAGLFIIKKVRQHREIHRAKIVHLRAELRQETVEDFLSASEKSELKDGLATFGLAPSASIKDLKGSYREAVKKLHPDNNDTTADTDTFIKLTQSYERVFELLEKAGNGRAA